MMPFWTGRYENANEHLMYCRRMKKKDIVVKLLLGIVSVLMGDIDGGRIYLNDYLSRATVKQRKLLRKKVARLIPRKEDRSEVLSELKLYEFLHKDYRQFASLGYNIVKVEPGTRVHVGSR